MVTKKILADSLAKFIENDLILGIDDKQLKFVLCMMKNTLKDSPSILDSFLDNPVISTVVIEEEGSYDVSDLISAMKSVIAEMNSYPIVIPKIPVLLPDERIIKINANDIDKIIHYINSMQEEIA